jgi:putative peptidoglycan lipid II flippase
MNAQGRFALTAFSPLLFNIALIAVMAVLLFWRQDAARAALIIAGVVGIAGLLQLSILILRRGENAATPLRVSFDAGHARLPRQSHSGMIASSGPQLLMVAAAIDRVGSPSAVSWLYFANRLIELPLGLVGVAMGTVLMRRIVAAVTERRCGRRLARGIARARTRGGPGAASYAGADRAGGADRAAAVRARRVHRQRYGRHRARAGVAGARAAGAGAVQGAGPGLLRAREHGDAARRRAQGHRASRSRPPSCSATCSAPKAIAAGIALGAWSSALSLVARGAHAVRLRDRRRRARAAAAHRGCAAW